MAIEDTCQNFLRDSSGRFTGRGAFDSDTPAVMTEFTSLSDADQDLLEAMEAVEDVLATPEDDALKVPAVVVRASPGAGKSWIARSLLSEWEKRGNGKQVSFYLPTLALAEEAAAEARALGLEALAIRGRSAPLPVGKGQMCARADLVERAHRLGLSAPRNFCTRKDGRGREKRCPHFEDCAFLAQFREKAKVNFLATSYLSLPDPVEACDLRIVDETFWQQFVSIRDVPVALFTAPRTHFPVRMNEQNADLQAVAKQVVTALMQDMSPLSLPLSHTEYKELVALEWHGKAQVPDLSPDQSDQQQSELLKRAETDDRNASGFAAIWQVLADAKSKGLDATDRLRLVADGDKQVIRVLKRKPLKHKQPMLVLDADAETAILSALGCDIHKVNEVTLRPNAYVCQLHDRRMTNGSLLGQPDLREAWRRIIAREVLLDCFDRKGGVLVGATRKVVKAFFEDAGYDFSGQSEARISEIMLTAKLHGANWLWFGGRALGSNRYQNCATVIVIGREELPVSALEDQARALWGDEIDPPLSFLTPGPRGQIRMPEDPVAYEMANGTSKAVLVPGHPDPRVRCLQKQSREQSSRQLIERLRLARAIYRKKVIIGCNIPIPGIPVDRLVSWEELAPSRLEAAIVDGLLKHGSLLMTPQGLVEAAPQVFSTVEAARTYLKRRNPKAQLGDFLATISQANAAVVVAEITREVRYARKATAFFLSQPETAKDVAERIWGELKHFKWIDMPMKP